MEIKYFEIVRSKKKNAFLRKELGVWLTLFGSNLKFIRRRCQSAITLRLE